MKSEEEIRLLRDSNASQLLAEGKMAEDARRRYLLLCWVLDDYPNQYAREAAVILDALVRIERNSR